MSVEFIDSNVLIYLFDETDVVKREIAEDLVIAGIERGSSSISFQVVQETLNIITRRFPAPASDIQSRQFFEDVLIPLWSVMPTPGLYTRALDIRARYRYGFYDALIIAAACESGCSVLYSEDMQHGQKIENVTIRNPFAT